MKINILLLFLFVTFTFAALSDYENGHDETLIIGATELNGQGCVCHNLESSSRVKAWVEGPDTLIRGETGMYRMYLTGGPAEAGGYNVAGRFGIMGLVDTLSKWDYRAPNELTQSVPLEFPSTDDTIFWQFNYRAKDSVHIDTIYSVGLSIVYDSIPDNLDLWAFGPKFPVSVIDQPTSIENEEIIQKDFELEQNYPNPFNPSTNIKFRIPESGFVSLKIYDILGNEVVELINEERTPGNYNLKWNASGLSSGIYFYQLNFSGSKKNFSSVKKMILTK